MYFFAFRLGFNQQLIKDPHNIDVERGIELPGKFCPDQISLLVQPDSYCNHAIVLLSARCKEGYHYTVCQLQCRADENKHCMVFASTISVGTLLDKSLAKNPNPSSISRICGLFLVGASFQFDLSPLSPVKKRDTGAFATIGVFHNLARSISSFTISSKRETSLKKIFDLHCSSNHKAQNNWIEKMWLSDILPTSTNNHGFWMDFSFITSDGSSYVWSYLSNESDTTSEERDSFVLGPLQLFSDDDPEKSKILLGPLSSISDRFLAYAAQERRKIHLPKSNHQVGSKEISLFCVSDCMVGVPTFTSSLVSQFAQRIKGNEVSFQSFYTI